MISIEFAAALFSIAAFVLHKIIEHMNAYVQACMHTHKSNFIPNRDYYVIIVTIIIIITVCTTQ